jgi:membrane associated rhomboid family serine protease
MPRPQTWQRNLTFGGRVPWGAGALLAVTLVLSLLVALLSRRAPMFDFCALRPALVWKGQIWRLVTWPFVEPDPVSLIFGCLAIYWFGAPLAQVWGSRRFLLVYAGVAASTAIGTCLVALVDPAVREATFLGGWAMKVALVVAWGLWFPNQVVRIYFLIPIRGYWFAWGTVALTVIFAAYTGWAHLVLELFAELSVLAWLFRRWLFGRWAELRRSADTNLRSVPRKPARGVVVDVDFRGDRAADDDKPN